MRNCGCCSILWAAETGRGDAADAAEADADADAADAIFIKQHDIIKIVSSFLVLYTYDNVVFH